jgi:hypothetical protein
VRSGATQRDRILRLLQSRAGQWMPLYEITPLAPQYKTRLKESRERGHIIENHIRHVSGVVHSWFHLIAPRGQTELFNKAQEVTAAR